MKTRGKSKSYIPPPALVVTNLSIFLTRLLKDPSFVNTFSLGVEGYSKPPKLTEMPILRSSTGEFTAVFLLLGVALPILAMGRKTGEDSIRAEVKTTNRYAKFDLGRDTSFSKWTLGDASKL